MGECFSGQAEDQQTQMLRQRMVMTQLAERGIQDTRVLDVMAEVRRQCFLPSDMRHLAYEDVALPIAEGQTISQPYMVAVMTEALRLKGRERVLEIGTGSGYQAAILSRLAKEVISIERHPPLAEHAARLLRDLGYNNIEVVIGDGTRGLPTRGPFDSIIVTAGAPAVPEALVSQLAEGGRFIIPVGEAKKQMLLCLTRKDGKIQHKEMIPCVFVPLIGAQGWQAAD